MRRAELHLGALHRELRAFQKRKTYRIAGEFEPDTSKYIFRLKLRRDPSLRWGVITGDILNNFRSALDHLVYQLALLTADDPRGTGFPIFTCERSRDREARTFAKEGQRMIRHVPDACKPFFELYQPYKRPQISEAHVLEVLRTLSNMDKHQVVPATATGMYAGSVNPTPIQDVEWVEHYTFHFGRPLQHNAEIAYAQIVPSGPDPEIELNAEPAFHIVLSHVDPLLDKCDVLGLLNTLGGYIGQVLLTFEPAFTGASPVLVGQPNVGISPPLP